jgi:hypothetical protein
MGWAVDFRCVVFFVVVEVRFCWGFWRNVDAACGVFVVRLWWNAWSSWWVDSHFSGDEVCATICKIIFLDGARTDFRLTAIRSVRSIQPLHKATLGTLQRFLSPVDC